LSEFLRAAFAAVFLNTCRAHRRVLRLAIADAGWRPSAKKSAWLRATLVFGVLAPRIQDLNYVVIQMLVSGHRRNPDTGRTDTLTQRNS
jgi:hypothetical protein